MEDEEEEEEGRGETKKQEGGKMEEKVNFNFLNSLFKFSYK
jgi:hypothetical protein